MTNVEETENHHEGHRDRLRMRFLLNPQSISETEKLELLLTYAIPRKDVSLLAKSLIQEFGSIFNVLLADHISLVEKFKITSSVIFYLDFLKDLFIMKNNPEQDQLFDLKPITKNKPIREKRVFSDDETQNSIKFLPEALKFSNINEYKTFLQSNLPYNSEETRKRRASYIIHRFFPTNELTGVLNFFLSKSTSPSSLKTVVFYSILNVEPLAQKVAEQLVFSNLPLGFIRRNQLKEFVEKQQPDITPDSINKVLIALSNLYQETDTAKQDGDRLNFSLRKGDLEGFLYVFSSEYPEPGMFSFDQLFNSPVHRWMLWDKEWIRNQLYNLHDLGIVSKISEIDSMNQFTVGMKQSEALQHFFEVQTSHPTRAIREKYGE